MRIAIISESDEENQRLLAIMARTRTPEEIYTEIHAPIRLAEKITREEAMRETVSTFLKTTSSGMESLNAMISRASELYGRGIVFKLGKELLYKTVAEFSEKCELLEVPFGSRFITMIKKK